MSGSALAHLLHIETLVSVAARLAAQAPLTDAERQIVERHRQPVDAGLVERIRDEITGGADPLGSAYCLIHSPAQRRGGGQTFTPLHVIEGMFGWAAKQGRSIGRIVDPGAGAWVATFGEMVIPGAALRGVFKPEYVGDAQAAKVALFWGHRLGDLAAFIAATRR